MRKIFTSLKASFMLLAMFFSFSASVFAGTGTKEDPYTTTEVVKLGNPGDKAWVKAVIMGYYNNGKLVTSDFTESHVFNFAISSDGGTTIVPVELDKGSIRNELNLYENPDHFGKEVLLEGSLIAYFGKPGLKDLTAYEWADNTPPAVATPTFSIASGTYQTEQTVEILCETEGAKIYYTTDETTPTTASTLYTEPIAISETTTLSAIAIKGEDKSAVSTCKLSFPSEEVMTIADFITNADKENISTLNDVVVVYHILSNLYVLDETGYLLIYGPTSKYYNPGDVISGIYGKYNEYNSLPQMKGATIPDASSTQEAPKPRPVTKEEQANLTIRDASSYVVLVNETLTEAPDWTNGDKTNATLSSGNTLRNEFKHKLDTEVDTPYDITCIVSIFKGKIQFFPISIEATATGVEGVTKDNSVYANNGKVYINTTAGNEIEIYNVTGQRIANTIATEGLNAVSVDASSVILVKVGNKVHKVVM